MKLELTNDQHQWVDQWLQLWGAWCQTGKIDKAMINMIASWLPSSPSKHHDRYVVMMTGCSLMLSFVTI